MPDSDDALLIVSAPHRIAVLSDLHGNSIATAAILTDIDRANVDAIYCLGDLVGYGPFPNETIDLIRQREIPTIVGNYDDGVGFDRDDCGCAYKDDAERDRGQQSLMWTRAIVTNERKAYLRSLMPEIRLEVNGIRLRLVHGSPRRMNEYLFEDRGEASLERIAAMADCDVLLFGHTHIPWSRPIGGVQMINIGSVGKPKDGDPRAAWALLEVGSRHQVTVTMHRVRYDIASVATAIREADGLPDHYALDIEHGGATR